VAPIAHHSGDLYQNTYSTARISYYGITGFPHVKFDGILSQSGASGNMYPNYLNKVNQRMNVLSNFTLLMNGSNEDLAYTIMITAEKVAPYAGTNLVLHFVWVESHIPQNWGGLTEVNFVNRLMVPGASGTPLDFSVNPVQAITLNFTKTASWVTGNSHLIAFIQDNTTKEVLQGFMVKAEELMPMYFDNASCLDVTMVPVTNCSGEVAPTVTIMNEGASSLTTLDINYKVNDEIVQTYNWSGNLSYGAIQTVNLPAIAFEIQETNNLVIYPSNPNGNPDEDPVNDTVSFQFAAGQEAIPNVYLYLKLDDNPEETSYELKNSSGTVLYTGGPYTVPNAFMKDTFELALNDCYTFIIYDQGGNGLTSPGYFTLRQSNYAIIYENSVFSESGEMVEFSVNLTGIAEQEDLTFDVYPNPVKDYTLVHFNLKGDESVELVIYNLVGKQVFESGLESYGPGNHSIKVEAAHLQTGIYFVNLRIGDQMFTRKITRY
jgi:hypothetical protein